MTDNLNAAAVNIQPLEKLIKIPKRQRWVEIEHTLLRRINLQILNHELRFSLPGLPQCNVVLRRHTVPERLYCKVTVLTLEHHWPNDIVANLRYPYTYAALLNLAAHRIAVHTDPPVIYFSGIDSTWNSSTFELYFNFQSDGDTILRDLLEVRRLLLVEVNKVLSIFATGPEERLPAAIPADEAVEEAPE
ncbi:MAG: hypothetical protein ABJF10_06570 [Chthoniobacter sp.]|uniref:hypothetical protein n=1 Tax=Chthoniobacter sp. TaxID=2510640 RepID=UPI0032A32A4C